LPDFFGLCPRCQKKISGETCCRRGGGRSDYEKFLLDSIFPTKLTEFPTKLTEFVPFIFIISQYCPTVKRILPDWLCLPNKLGGLPPPPPLLIELVPDLNITSQVSAIFCLYKVLYSILNCVCFALWWQNSLLQKSNAV
jgi:hypothetical protein